MEFGVGSPEKIKIRTGQIDLIFTDCSHRGKGRLVRRRLGDRTGAEQEAAESTEYIRAEGHGLHLTG
jgi:hypothetical protein